MSLELKPKGGRTNDLTAVLSLTAEDVDLLVKSEALDLDAKVEISVRALVSGGPLISVTAENFPGLISGASAERLRVAKFPLSTLKSHLDHCRANYLVRVRVVDCGGHLVYKTELHSGSLGVPWLVRHLRNELAAHFEQVEASYGNKVCRAIRATMEDINATNGFGTGRSADGGTGKEQFSANGFGATMVGINADGTSNRTGTFIRRPIFSPKPHLFPGGHVSLNATRFPLDGVTFHSRPGFGSGAFVGEFFFDDGGGVVHKIGGDLWNGGGAVPMALLLRDEGWDPSIRFGASPSLSRRFSRISIEEVMVPIRTVYISVLAAYVRNHGDSLELVLDRSLFEEDTTPARGFPWTARFSSLEVKKRFVELVESFYGLRISMSSRAWQGNSSTRSWRWLLLLISRAWRWFLLCFGKAKHPSHQRHF